MGENNRNTGIALRILRLLLLSIACLTPLILVGVYLAPRALPWWSDTGEWIKYANGIEGDILRRIGRSPEDRLSPLKIPMWEQGSWQYPPLFFLLLILLRGVVDQILALKLLAVFVVALQPIPAYLIAKRISGTSWGGVVAAYCISLSPLYLEMVGWGGYPNLLGFFLLGMATYSIIRYIDHPGMIRLGGVIGLSILVVLSHHITGYIYSMFLAFWLVLMALVERGELKKTWFPVMIALGSTLVTAILYLVLLAGQVEYTYYNEAALYGLRFEFLPTVPWLFKQPLPIITIGLLILTAFFGVKWSLGRRFTTLFFSWSVVPSIATLGFLFGLAIDYNRVFFFAVQPILILPGAILAILKRRNPHPQTEATIIYRFLGKAGNALFNMDLKYRSWGSYLIAALAVLAAIGTFTAGAQTMGNVDTWYSSKDLYGDKEKLVALDWIQENTPGDSVFVADETMGRWIEGYGQRRVMLHMEPRFFFIKGQIERYHMASSVLKSNYEVRTCSLRIFEQAPYGIAANPIIQIWHGGEYKEIVFSHDIRFNAFYLSNGKLMSMSPQNKTSAKALMNKTASSIEIFSEYLTPLFKFQRRILVGMREDGASLEYRVIPLNSSITFLTANITLVPSEERTVRLLEASGPYAHISTEIGSIRLWAQGNEIEVKPDSRYTSGRGIQIGFRPQKDGQAVVLIRLDFESTLPSRKDPCLLESFSKQNVMRDNRIDYVVIPRLEKPGVRTLDAYQHLLNDKLMKIVYLNDRVIVLQSLHGRGAAS